MIHLLNIIFGLIPTLILGASIAAGVDDDSSHRRMFLFVYGLWAITLAMWNWMRSAPPAWTILWLISGILTLGYLIARRSMGAPTRKESS
ncbi:MAG TPA: hypothetical protein VHX14_17305 [Thermoanaerobaculia bacterium]|jgi:hypothetical protein|nr:hypothetical protein [Thermoanaerobaculia bacterium]